MASPDSIVLFAEGTFEEQVRELVDYLARGLEEDARITFIKPFSEALVSTDDDIPFSGDPDRRRKLITLVLAEVKTLGQGSERETEGFFNLLFAHIISLFPATEDSRTHITPLLSTISSTTSESPMIKYRILSNLFNALPRTSTLRYEVYSTLLPLAVSNKDLEILQITKPSVDAWLIEWDVSPEQKYAILKAIADAFLAAGQTETAYGFLVARLESLPSSVPAIASATDVLVTALRLPVSFDLTPLLKLKALQILEDHPLYILLKIFTHGHLQAWTAWSKANASTLTEYGLDTAALDRKLRFLTFSSLATLYIGKDLPYTEIASALQITADSVEVWVIDAIRSKIVSGKLSQPTQSFHVTRSSTLSRPFDKPQWSNLEQRLVAWRSGLVGVLETVAGAREVAYPTGKIGAGKEESLAPKEKTPIVHGDLAPAAKDITV